MFKKHTFALELRSSLFLKQKPPAGSFPARTAHNLHNRQVNFLQTEGLFANNFPCAHGCLDRDRLIHGLKCAFGKDRDLSGFIA
jgi:hypothetical protein